MNYKSTVVMMLLGATQAIRITKVGDPVTATDAGEAVEAAHEGIADARTFVNIGVRFVQHPNTNPPVNAGEAPLSETATAGVIDGRANQGFAQLGDELNTRNKGYRSISQKWMGTRAAADPISPENMDDWVYEYSKDNTNWSTQWQDLKHKPEEYATLQTAW